jgi:hypothetical protein
VSDDSSKHLQEAGRILDGAIKALRRVWETPEEMRRRIEAEVEEEFRVEPPSHQPPGGPRWLPTYLTNWFPGGLWSGRKGKRSPPK